MIHTKGGDQIKSYAKLDADQVHRIRVLLAGGMSQMKVAIVFGVCRKTITDIYAGRTWKWLG